MQLWYVFPGDRSNIKMQPYQHRKSHFGANRHISTMGFPVLVIRHLYIKSSPGMGIFIKKIIPHPSPSYIHNGNPFTGKTSLYWVTYWHDLWQLIRIFIQQLTGHVITCPCWDLSLYISVKGTLCFTELGNLHNVLTFILLLPAIVFR